MNNEEKEKSDLRKKKMLEYLKDLDTKGNVVHSGIELVKTIAITGLGILVGSQLGRPSLLAGMAAAFAGNYIDQPKLTQLGIGLMASGGYQSKQKGLSGIEGVKENLKVVGEDVKHRLYLDKFIKPKAKALEEGTSGLGEVQYFKYPNNDIDMGALDSIEDEITRSSEQYEKRQMAGSYDDINGLNGRII